MKRMDEDGRAKSTQAQPSRVGPGPKNLQPPEGFCAERDSNREPIDPLGKELDLTGFRPAPLRSRLLMLLALYIRCSGSCVSARCGRRRYNDSIDRERPVTMVSHSEDPWAFVLLQ